MAYITEVEKQIAKLDKSEIVKIGGMTDCFQPYETRERVTWATIKLLNTYKINYLIVTKSSTVIDPGYLAIYDPYLAHFQISITCTDNDKSAEYEKCSSVTDRIKAIEILHKMEFDVSIRLSPFIPEYTDKKLLSKIRCKKILVEFLKVNYWIKNNFTYDYSKHTLDYGGYKNIHLDDKIELVKIADEFEQHSVGEYVREHHDYFRTNYNWNHTDCCNVDIRKIYNDCEQLELKFK